MAGLKLILDIIDEWCMIENITFTEGERMCLLEGCNRETVARGLCWPCYKQAQMFVKKGRATWDQLIAAGWALPARNCKRGTNPFSQLAEERFPLIASAADAKMIQAAPDSVIEAAKARFIEQTCDQAMTDHIASIPPYREYEEPETASDKDLAPWSQPN